MLNLSRAIINVLHTGALARREGGRLSWPSHHGQILGWSHDNQAFRSGSPIAKLSYMGRNLPIRRSHGDLRMLNACIHMFERAVVVMAGCEESGLCSMDSFHRLLTNIAPLVLSSLDEDNFSGAEKGVITKASIAKAKEFQNDVIAGAVRLEGAQLANVLGEEVIGIIHPVIMRLMSDREFMRFYSSLLGSVRTIQRSSDRTPAHGWILSEAFKSSDLSDEHSIPLLFTSCLALGAVGRTVADSYLMQDVSDEVNDFDPDKPVVNPLANSIVALDYVAGLVLSAKSSRAIDTLALPYSPRGKRVIRSTNGVTVNFEYDVIVRQMEVSLFHHTDASEALALSQKLKEGVRSTLSIRESEFTTLVGGSGVGKSTRVAEIIESLIECRGDVERATGRKVNIFFADTSEPSTVVLEASNDPVIPVTDSPMARIWSKIRAGEVIPLHGMKPFGADLTEMLTVLESSGVVGEKDLNILILDSASDLVDEAQMVNPSLRSGSRAGGRDSAIRKVFQQQTNALSRGGWAVLQTVNLQSMPGHRDQANDFAFTYSISGGSDVTALLLGGSDVPFIRDRSAGAMFVDDTALGILHDPNAAYRFPDATAGTVAKPTITAVK